MKSAGHFPFRLGTTSYIIPSGLVENVRFLGDKVQDVELVIFDREDGLNNLPDKETVDLLAGLANDYQLTYTIHLPEDLRPAEGGQPEHSSVAKARRLIERTNSLAPVAYITHLDGREIRAETNPAQRGRWQEQAVQMMENLGCWVGDPGLFAVENLEGYPVDFIDPVVDRLPVSRCVDIGHLWLDGHDPVAYLQTALQRTKVVHLHGIGSRDHQSLRLVPKERLNTVLSCLISKNYTGVLTLEIFGEEDFVSSLKAMRPKGLACGTGQD